jgi:hypothetical protein
MAISRSHAFDAEPALEQAHLLYLRGDYAGAREVLEVVLSADASNREAYALREQVERADVERTEGVEAERDREVSDELDPRQTVLIAVAGIALVVVAVWSAVPTVALGMRIGFGTTIVATPFGYRSGPAHYPVHILFAWPLLVFLLGAYMLRRAWRQVRA